MTTNYDPTPILEQLGPQRQLLELFAVLPDVYFYAKDVQGRFFWVNPTEALFHNFRDPAEMQGCTDFDLHPRHMAEQYVDEDRRVMESRVPLKNQMWMVHGHGGKLRWFLSSKTPLFAADGRLLGIAGVMRDFERAEAFLRPFQELGQTVTYVLEHFAERIEVPALAALVNLSVSQFDRRFKQVFQITPQQYILRVRLNAAVQALLSTEESVARIAAGTGFYDQSYFAKQFRKWSGMTPLEYRQRYRETTSLPLPSH